MHKNQNPQVAKGARSILQLVPPLAEGMAATIFVEGDEEDAIELGLEAAWNNDERSPPACNSLLWRCGEDLVSKLNVLFGLSYVRPVIENGLLAAHRFDERRDLIGAVFGEQVRSGVRVAACPSAAVSVQPR